MNVENYRCIAVVGGGGKTSLIFYLAGLFVKKGKRVVIGSSTHMGYEMKQPFAPWEDWDTVINNVARYGYTMVGICDGDVRKITCPPDCDWSKFFEVCDVLLIEADGARMLPLKVPAAYEPVIPQVTDLVIGVAGLDSIGKPVRETCHRAELVCSFLGKAPEEVIEPEDIVKICSSETAMRKDTAGRDYKVILNKADTSLRRQMGAAIRDELLNCLPKVQNPEVEVMTLGRKRIHVILLAAGNSRRFGQENKLLYSVNGKTMFEGMFEQVMALGCGSVIVVTQYEEIAEIVCSHQANVVYNKNPEEGIAASMRLGVLAESGAKAWLFCVCDQPYLTAESLEGLIDCYLSGGKGIAAMACGSHMGNPSIFSEIYEEELLALTGDVGGRQIIKQHPDDVALYWTQNEKELMDVDEPM